MSKILIVEDDITIHNLLKELLQEYVLLDAYSGTEALLLLEKNDIDLILLDLNLPGLSGEEIIKKINNIPIIVISAKTSIDDKVNNLLNGAIDYITKPFNNKELLARIKTNLKRNKNIKHNLTYKELKLLNDNHTLLVNNNKISLTKTEYAIIKQLIIHEKEVIPKNKLLDLISIDTLDCDENSLKVHISNIRKKIKQYSSHNYIEAVWGIGFKLYD